MLKSLHIENYILIENLDIEFDEGLNIITGETGAGKSILLGALGLLLGDKIDTPIYMNNDKNIIIEALFEFPEELPQAIQDYFSSLASKEDILPKSITVRKVITSQNNRSRSFINDLPITQSSLKSISSSLVDIHSQHHNLLLNNSLFQYQVLDSYCNHLDLIASFKEQYSLYKSLLTKLKALRNSNTETSQKIDYLSSAIEEISSLRLKEDEQLQLEKELEIFDNSAEIKTALNTSFLTLDSDKGVISLLKSVEVYLKRISTNYPASNELLQRVSGSLIEIKDISLELENLESRIDFNEADILRMQSRIDLIYSLNKKYRVSNSNELLLKLREFTTELDTLVNFDSLAEELEQKSLKILKELTAKAELIHNTRVLKSKEITKTLSLRLSSLGIPYGRFVVEITPTELSTNGIDLVKFLFSSNEIHSPEEIVKVASGGELSRIMLLLKSILIPKNSSSTIFFDEIDTGVSGEVANKIGELICEMTTNHQVMNITHLPQVASKGRTHFYVYKEQQGSQVRIKKLTKQERIVEIAKMLSGSKVTEVAKLQAEVLINN